MSRRERQQLFAVAAGVVVVVLLALSALGGSDHERMRPRPSPATPSIVGAKSDPRASREAERRQIDHAAAANPDARLAEPRWVARRFIAAFARYQGGRLDEQTVRRLRTLATPQVATYLLAQPPREGSSPSPRVQITRLDLTGPQSGPVKAAALLAYRHRPRSLFEVQLERLDGRWRVSRLYPSEG